MANGAPAKDRQAPAPEAPVYEVKPPKGAKAKVRFNAENLKSSYVNFANANATREEVVINFGLNASWDRVDPDLQIALEHRVVMSPHAAGRLADLLAKLMAQYQARYGELR